MASVVKGEVGTVPNLLAAGGSKDAPFHEQIEK